MSLLEQLAALEPVLRDEIAAIVRAEVIAALEAAAPRHGEPWRLLTLDEACKRLGRSERQVREWARSGELASIRLDGGALRFDPDDVRAFARARRVGGPEMLASGWQAPPEARRGARSQDRRRAVDRRVGDA